MFRKHTYSQLGNVIVCDQTGEVTRIRFGDRWFELCGETTRYHIFDGNDVSEIYDVYGAPSETKVEIWKDWCKWAYDNHAHLRIGGHSCHFYSIYGTLQDADGTLYSLEITYAHNRCYIVND